MTKEQVQWYKTWFDTPYYHILYKDRDHREAKKFMIKLTNYLGLNDGDKILDLACGRGRHSLFLGSLGYQVTGADLSKSSIAYASQFANKNVNFVVHDMCIPFPDKFSAVFNLFTSFGYFENEEDNQRTLSAIKKNLNNKGMGVIDFMNAPKVISNLIPQEVKRVEHIEFHIKRYVQNGFIFKEIEFEDNNVAYSFIERVKIITLLDFKEYFKKCNIKLLQLFGNYELESFDETFSTRLILVFK